MNSGNPTSSKEGRRSTWTTWNGAPAPVAAAPAPVAVHLVADLLPHPLPGFVARPSEWHCLDDLHDTAAEVRPRRLAVVVGPAGSG